MTLKKRLALAATAAMLAGSLLCTPAVAQSNSGFSALNGVDAQALSVDEMQAIQGLINNTNIVELTLAITNDPNLSADAKRLLLAAWSALVKLDGTKYEFLADRFFLLLKPRYPLICGLNADFCGQ